MPETDRGHARACFRVLRWQGGRLTISLLRPIWLVLMGHNPEMGNPALEPGRFLYARPWIAWPIDEQITRAILAPNFIIATKNFCLIQNGNHCAPECALLVRCSCSFCRNSRSLAATNQRNPSGSMNGLGRTPALSWALFSFR